MKEPTQNVSILITGGSGFVGRAVLRELADENSLFSPKKIRVLDNRPLPKDLGDTGIPIEFIDGDIRDKESLKTACDGMDAVIHLASMVDWGTHPKKVVFDINVEGTRNVVGACAEAGVKALVYTSSLDAIFSGKPIHNADETFPYPEPFTNAYSETKAAAEKIITTANGESLKTVALRPSGIYGEADPYHLGSLIKMAKGGPFFKIGNGKSKCMHIYVGNVAHAHLLAARELLGGNEKLAGNIYFLVDMEPENFFDCLCPVLESAGIKISPNNTHRPDKSPVSHSTSSA